jgi:iron complex transport system permease protein
MNSKNTFLVVIAILFTVFLLIYGETGFSLDPNILIQLRLPKIIACFFAGGLLALAGLLMQIFFQNPLAGPDILGVNSGSSLFVAFWMMASFRFSQTIINWGMSAMSFLGAISVLLILMFLMRQNISRVSLIIIGLLISSFTSSGISILVSTSQALQLKSFLVWSMGSFRNITLSDLPRFIILSLISIFPVLFFIKKINQFLLSENYAQSMGVDVKQMKYFFVIVAAMQISVVTLFCGPIGFIGVISSHLARQMIKRTQLRVLLPAVFLIGAILAFIAESIIVLTPSLSISVNAVLGLIGAPVIVYYLYHKRDWSL